jgi:hypothetical protein
MDLVDTIPEWVQDHAETLIRYGAKTRYSSLRVASSKVVYKLYDYVGEYLDDIKPKEYTDNDAIPTINE